jgi:hypothetical protein
MVQKFIENGGISKVLLPVIVTLLLATLTAVWGASSRTTRVEMRLDAFERGADKRSCDIEILNANVIRLCIKLGIEPVRRVE